ncbi:MAG: hypothetical protein JST22_12285 [Bacteroidetes bacterium]|nr:hypothetical protein [Bacteroidota bacterium]
MSTTRVDIRLGLLKKKKEQKRHGVKITRRKDMMLTRRFIVDHRGNLLHDLAREKPSCGLDELLSAGTVSTFCEPPEIALASGYGVCPNCIGRSITDTFNGTNTVLFVMQLPQRGASQLDGVLEREEFTIRMSAIHNELDDERKLVGAIADNNARTVFYQAFRRDRDDMCDDTEPDMILQVGSGDGPDDDVIIDVFAPMLVLRNEAARQPAMTKLVQELAAIGVIHKALDVHARRYRYRNALLFFHACETVDEWVRNRPDAKCSMSSAGASAPSGSVTPYVNASPDGTVYAGATYHK